ncbi:MAG: hypothetical protein AAB657_04115 [Patescibacteria group bacterium]
MDDKSEKNIIEGDTMPILPEIKLFLTKLMVEKGVFDLPTDLQTDLLESLHQRLQAFLLLTLTNKLSTEQVKQMDGLMESGEMDMIKSYDFFRASIKDVDEVVAKAMMDFRQVYLTGTPIQ